uniref:PARP catalytic domain-containing protein n=1 Tax=Sphaeramia orbicularis TaxID=375764 RepID=A0A673AKL1_9TELE
TSQISLSGPSSEITQEAKLWLCGILKNSSGVASICNNFIQYFGEQDFGLLSRQIRQGVQMEEFLEKGRAGIIINGSSADDLAVSTIKVEAILCRVQSDFVTEEVGAIRDLLPNTEVVFERKTLDKYSSEFSHILSTFQHQHLQVQKVQYECQLIFTSFIVEKVENTALKLLFEMKKKQLSCSTTRTMFQRLPAQFCEMVSRIGFHAECAPPDDPACGEGIYFADSVKKAMDMWTGQKEEYMYFVEAEVITGKSTPGKRGLILPPPLGSDPHARYDSVSGGADIFVIFSSYQALPKYIITSLPSGFLVGSPKAFGPFKATIKTKYCNIGVHPGCFTSSSQG